MSQNLKARFEQLAADQLLDPSIEVVQVEHRTEKPIPGSGWGHSGNSGGGHTGHDGKFKPNKSTVEISYTRKETKKGIPPPKSFADLP